MDPTTARLFSRTPLLKGVRKEALAKLFGKCEVRELERRATLFRQGDDATGVGIVRSGVLREEVGEGDDRSVLRFARAGDLVGEVAFLGGHRHETEGVAHEEATIVWIPAAAFEALLHEPGCARRLAGLVAEGRRQLEARLHAGRRGVEARVAARLAELADRYGVRDSRGVIVNLRITHRELAALAGTSRESASLLMGAWQRDGVIATDAARRFVVLDPAALARLAGAEPAA